MMYFENVDDMTYLIKMYHTQIEDLRQISQSLIGPRNHKAHGELSRLDEIINKLQSQTSKSANPQISGNVEELLSLLKSQFRYTKSLFSEL